MNRINYRRIYEEHYGPIPVDENGVKYDIHHINGNHNDNRPENLMAVTIQEHYNIHLEQGDLCAAALLSYRLEKGPAEVSRLIREANEKRLADGTHPFLDKERIKKMYAEGKHPFVGGKLQKEVQEKRVAEGTHHFLGGALNRERVAKGTHHFVGGELSKKRVAEGTHHFLQKHTCPYCSKTGKGPSMKCISVAIS